MGMYTQLVFGAELKLTEYSQVKSILKYMLGEDDKPKEIPNHPLFQAKRWEIMFQSDSYYFDFKANSRLIEDEQESIYLNIICNLKNYDNEIQKFIAWIQPYLLKESGDFLGYFMYEEDSEPTLIYKD